MQGYVAKTYFVACEVNRRIASIPFSTCGKPKYV